MMSLTMIASLILLIVEVPQQVQGFLSSSSIVPVTRSNVCMLTSPININVGTRRSSLFFDTRTKRRSFMILNNSKDNEDKEVSTPLDINGNIAKAPSFNGKTVFPIKVFMNGLKGHTVAAVFAVLNDQYKRGEEGWNHVQHISITKDLFKELQNLQATYPSDKVANIRALSFVYPQKSAMQDVANRWTSIVQSECGGLFEPWGGVDDNHRSREEITEANNAATMEMVFMDDDDDYDEFDDDDDYNILTTAQVLETLQNVNQSTKEDETQNNDIISPFELDSNKDSNSGEETQEVSVAIDTSTLIRDEKGKLTFTSENVHIVLDEIRPYLINDGGNVSVQKVDEQTRSVYLKLEGACGSCPSSTVTMSMGIKRVLQENFDNLGEVIQVEQDDDESNSNKDKSGLTMEAVMAELKRIGPAITAMGGTVEVVNVDPIGVVELKFRGSTKIQQGLELAIRDVPLVKHVKFVNN